MPVKNCCVVTKPSVRSAWTRVPKWKKVIIARGGPRGSCGKKALNRQIFIARYLHFVDRKHLHAALFSWLRSFNSVSGKETTQAAVHEWHRKTAREWFCEGIWKFQQK
jgi:hypothetical protein